MALFYLFGAVAVAASLLVIAQRNPIYSVLLLIASFGALSGLYVLLDAPFVAVIQIIVYAGAIMVLFLFVVMLLNAPHEETEYDERVHPLMRHRVRCALAASWPPRWRAELVWALTSPRARRVCRRGRQLGRRHRRLLFTSYAFPFEVTSILILVAMVGAVCPSRGTEGECPRSTTTWSFRAFCFRSGRPASSCGAT